MKRAFVVRQLPKMSEEELVEYLYTVPRIPRYLSKEIFEEVWNSRISLENCSTISDIKDLVDREFANFSEADRREVHRVITCRAVLDVISRSMDVEYNIENLNDGVRITARSDMIDNVVQLSDWITTSLHSSVDISNFFEPIENHVEIYCKPLDQRVLPYRSSLK